MKVYLSTRDKLVTAEGLYDETTGELVVKKGAKVSAGVNTSKTFEKASVRISKMREGAIENGVLLQDTKFSSPSTAASFLLGTSSNGLLRWKNADGVNLKNILSKDK